MIKKKPGYLLISAIGCFTILNLTHLTKPFVAFTGKPDEFHENISEAVLGTFDRNEIIDNKKAIAIKHSIIKWNNEEITNNKKYFLDILKEKQDILLTIEMWSKRGEAYKPHGILQGMVNGDYDKKIRDFCDLLSTSQNRIYLRWNPEMEVPVKKYQWQGQSSYLYNKAFCHFAKICKKVAPNVKIVWGPSGYAGVLEYWPGAEAVDVVSITLDTLPKDLSSNYPQERSIPVQIKRKLHRLRFINKPVLILGSEIVKKQNFRTQWIESAIQDIRKDTEIIYSQKNFQRTEASNTRKTKLEIGVFDPEDRLAGEKSISVEHLFANFSSLKDGVFKKDFYKVISRNHNVIVTMEFWHDKNLEKDSNVLINTINGHYDFEIQKLYEIISNVKQTVYLRWGHEMEIPINRYPWQSQDPVTYIKAFRYFMNFNKNKAKNIRRVWGPTGDRGALDWWPGDDVVDYISLAIYGLPDKNITDPNKQESFSNIFNRKYNRLRFVNKPIFITEFGVKGPQSYKRKWLDDAATTVNKNPNIIGVSYFNFTDSPNAWGDIEPPDWSISKQTLLHFTQQLENIR